MINLKNLFALPLALIFLTVPAWSLDVPNRYLVAFDTKKVPACTVKALSTIITTALPDIEIKPLRPFGRCSLVIQIEEGGY